MMMRMSTRSALVLLVATGLLVVAGPAPAQSQYGRTQFGYAGAALGATGGTFLGAAIVGAAGIANPLISGTIIATSALASGLVGSRVGSGLGMGYVDERYGPETIWMTVGALTGSLMGFIFTPGGHLIGKILGTAVGSFAGAWIGRELAKKASRDYNPRTIGALIGGINGALIGGPLGAAVGVPLGYIGGDLFDRYVFSDRGIRLGPRRRERRPPWDQGHHQYYPTDPTARYGDNGLDGRGHDREGFDRTGYDREGYDREGYDRFGYDRWGYDRHGYNRRGFKRVSGGGPSSESGPPADRIPTYDPKVYNDYWQAWGSTGGSYPKLGDEHWAKMPKESRDVARERYDNRAEFEKGVRQPEPPSEDLARLRQEYLDQLAKVQNLAKQGSGEVSPAELTRLRELENRLAERLRQGK